MTGTTMTDEKTMPPLAEQAVQELLREAALADRQLTSVYLPEAFLTRW